MKKNKLRYVFVFAIAALSGAMLLQTSQDVQKSEEEMASIQLGVDSEKESIHVLQAEWDYLNNPERLEALAAKYLDVQAAKNQQVLASPAALPDPFVPPADAITPALATTGMPIQAQPASLTTTTPSGKFSSIESGGTE